MPACENLHGIPFLQSETTEWIYKIVACFNAKWINGKRQCGYALKLLLISRHLQNLGQLHFKNERIKDSLHIRAVITCVSSTRVSNLIKIKHFFFCYHQYRPRHMRRTSFIRFHNGNGFNYVASRKYYYGASQFGISSHSNTAFSFKKKIIHWKLVRFTGYQMCFLTFLHLNDFLNVDRNLHKSH